MRAQAPEAPVRVGDGVRPPGLQPGEAPEPPVPRLPDDPDAAARHQQHQAIASALDRRLGALEATDLTATDEEPTEGELDEEDAQQQLEDLLSIRLAGLENEKEEVRLLLELAGRSEAQGPDARAETLLEILYENQRRRTTRN